MVALAGLWLFLIADSLRGFPCGFVAFLIAYSLRGCACGVVVFNNRCAKTSFSLPLCVCVYVCVSDDSRSVR